VAEIGGELFPGVAGVSVGSPGGLRLAKLAVHLLGLKAAETALAPLGEGNFFHEQLLFRAFGLEALPPGAEEGVPLLLRLEGADDRAASA
jgi:hypothetical protein